MEYRFTVLCLLLAQVLTCTHSVTGTSCSNGFAPACSEGTPTRRCLEAAVDLFASETGYYVFDGYEGPSPDIHARVGDTLVFRQRDETNWYHPLGFAFLPDGAHGSTWGAEENPEVEGLDQLAYFVNGERACGAGSEDDIGLDCYEPEFFYPREAWGEKEYHVELTITPELAAASHGGVLFYFCHIHSRMSGRIVLHNADGTRVAGSGAGEPELYDPVSVDPIDEVCGTYGLSPYAPGQPGACEERFVCGDLDTDFEKCLQAMDCQMNREMLVVGHDAHQDELATFSQQMIPHHVNAVNMARLLLKHVGRERLAQVDGFLDMVYDIINGQNFQIHLMRAYLGSHPEYLALNLTAESVGPHCDKGPHGAGPIVIGIGGGGGGGGGSNGTSGADRESHTVVSTTSFTASTSSLETITSTPVVATETSSGVPSTFPLSNVSSAETPTEASSSSDQVSTDTFTAVVVFLCAVIVGQAVVIARLLRSKTITHKLSSTLELSPSVEESMDSSTSKLQASPVSVV